MLKIITVAQQKGGAGKTTLSAHLAIAIMQTGKRVALVDVDPQGTLSSWYALREKKYDKADFKIALITAAGWRLNSVISQLQVEDQYDYLIIDSPPQTKTESMAAIRVADLVLIPMQPSPADAWATKSTLEFARNEKKQVKIVINRFKANSNMAKKITASIDDKLQSYLSDRIAFSSCFMQGLCVTEVEPSSQAAAEVRNLAAEILGLLNQKPNKMIEVMDEA